jgi:hypothetical protein
LGLGLIFECRWWWTEEWIYGFCVYIDDDDLKNGDYGWRGGSVFLVFLFLFFFFMVMVDEWCSFGLKVMDIVMQ